MEQLDYNLLFRWFVGLSMDAPVWDASTFSKNRDRLLEGDVAKRLLSAVVAQSRIKALMSNEHFSVDGTLIQAWAKLAKVPPAQQVEMPAEGSHKSFQPKPGCDAGPPAGDDPGAPPAGRHAERNWRGQKRSNETHASTTDPDARLARKSDAQASIMAYAGHVLMENRNGLVARSCLTHATGTAEREAAVALVDKMAPSRRITLGADKGYDVAGFIAALRARRVTPHVAVDGRVSKFGRATWLGRGRAHDAPRGLRRTSARAQTDRGGVRLDQGIGRIAADQASRPRTGRLAIRSGCRRLQPDPPTKAAGIHARVNAVRYPASSAERPWRTIPRSQKWPRRDKKKAGRR